MSTTAMVWCPHCSGCNPKQRDHIHDTCIISCSNCGKVLFQDEFGAGGEESEHPFAPDRGPYWFGGDSDMDISEENRCYDYDMCSRLAVNEYNLRYKEKIGLELKFVKVLAVTAQPSYDSYLITFYITFEAKDLANEGKVKIYQTELLMGPPHGHNPWSVKSLRLKPGQGSGHCEEKIVLDRAVALAWWSSM